MKYLSVTCSNCSTITHYTESSILSKKTLECPCCHQKIPAPFLRKLKSDIKYHQKHSDFEISIQNAPNISLSKLTETAMDKALNLTYEHYHAQYPNKTLDSFSRIIRENDPAISLCSTFTHQLLRQYHSNLIAQLSNYGIFLGELED